MANVSKASFCSPHVRKSNKAAIAVYRNTLGFEVARLRTNIVSGSLVICVDANFTIQIRRRCPFNASPAQRFIEMMDMCSIYQSKFPCQRRIDVG